MEALKLLYPPLMYMNPYVLRLIREVHSGAGMVVKVGQHCSCVVG
jgi:hypothetical protein